jgi:glycosyltransferase involved in cell wall biosynthesis
MVNRHADDEASSVHDTSLWLTPDAFLQRRGGVRRMALELNSALRAAGVPTRLVIDPSAISGHTTASIQQRLMAQARQQAALFRSTRNAIVHSLYYDLPLVAEQKSIVTVHDMMHERLGIGSSIIRRQKQRSVRRADVVVCDSECTVRDLVDMGIRSSSVQAIPLGISDAILEGAASSDGDDPGGQPYLLYVGDRGHYKNFDVLIVALASCPDLDDHRLVLVGGEPCSESALADWTTRRRGGAIEQKMAVTDEQLGSLYRSAAALVITSRYEGFGLPLLEAMACGCPVASSGGGSLAEYDGGLAARFDPDDSQGCRDAILTAIQSSAAERASGRDHAGAFTWANTADRYIHAYEQAGWKRS